MKLVGRIIVVKVDGLFTTKHCERPEQCPYMFVKQTEVQPMAKPHGLTDSDSCAHLKDGGITVSGIL